MLALQFCSYICRIEYQSSKENILVDLLSRFLKKLEQKSVMEEPVVNDKGDGKYAIYSYGTKERPSWSDEDKQKVDVAWLVFMAYQPL